MIKEKLLKFWLTYFYLYLFIHSFIHILFTNPGCSSKVRRKRKSIYSLSLSFLPFQEAVQRSYQNEKTFMHFFFPLYYSRRRFKGHNKMKTNKKTKQKNAEQIAPSRENDTPVTRAHLPYYSLHYFSFVCFA